MKQLLLFATPNCQPCKAFKPIFLNLKRKRLDILLSVVNAAQEPETARRYKVEEFPTLVYLEDGVWLGEKIHPTSLEDILEVIG